VGFAVAVALGVYRLASWLGLRPAVAWAALGALALAYGYRTYRRNPDWLSDETIFASAAEAAPASFKPHLSLADILYRQDPAFQQGDQAIWQAEAAEEIVRGLPDSLTPTVVPLELGRIYCARGDSLAPKDADGNPQSDAVSAEWYRKALEVDLHAVSVDRAFDADHRRRALAHGTSADRIAVAGLPEVYANLGRVYLRLGDPQRALEAFLAQRRVAPALPDSYINISLADRALHKTGDATVALLEAYTFDNSVETLYQALGLYRTTDSGVCAGISGAAGQSLNPDCAAVRRDLCLGYRDLEKAFRDAKQSDMEKRFQEAQGRVPGCQ
jgi:tetratricopeptide (TPR) repeat protein